MTAVLPGQVFAELERQRVTIQARRECFAVGRAQVPIELSFGRRMRKDDFADAVDDFQPHFLKAARGRKPPLTTRL